MRYSAHDYKAAGTVDTDGRPCLSDDESTATGGILAHYTRREIRSSYWRPLNRALVDTGIHRPSPSTERQRVLDFVDQQFTTVINVDHVIGRKRAAPHSHASQIGFSLAGKLPAAQFRSTFGIESYIASGIPRPRTRPKMIRLRDCRRATCLAVIRRDRAHD